MIRRRALAAAAALAVTVLSAGCDTARLGHLEFARDTRLSFTAPAARAYLKTTPVTVRWTMKDFAVTKGSSSGTTSGEYAVFVDASPVAVGDSIASVAASDTSCAKTPGCPDAEYLQQRGIYVTTTPSLTIDTLPTPISTAGSKEQHEVTVVLIDNAGVRTSESAWYVDFSAPKRSSV